MDANNRYYFKVPFGTKSLDLPIEIKWDFQGQEDSIEIWEKSAIEKL